LKRFPSPSEKEPESIFKHYWSQATGKYTPFIVFVFLIAISDGIIHSHTAQE